MSNIKEIKHTVINDMKINYWMMAGLFVGPAVVLSIINSLLIKLNVLSIGQVLVVAVTIVGIYFSFGSIWAYTDVITNKRSLNDIKLVPTIFRGIKNIASTRENLGYNMFYAWIYNFSMNIIFWAFLAVGLSISFFNLFVSSNFIHILNQLQTISMEEIVYFAQLPHINWNYVAVSAILAVAFYYAFYIPTKIINILIYLEPTLTPKERRDLAFAVIKGNREEFFRFQISFIGWVILSVLSLGIVGVFFLAPYYGGSEMRILIAYIDKYRHRK